MPEPHKASAQSDPAPNTSDSKGEASIPLELKIAGGDGTDLTAWHWTPRNGKNPLAVVQIVHGMAEHALRYQHVAEYFQDQGFAIIADDHRGHGSTSKGNLTGHYCDLNGWELIFHDLTAVRAKIEELYPDRPVIMLGHSMGSFMAQQYMIANGKDLAGVILSGSNYMPSLLAKLVRLIPWLESKRTSPQAKSWLVEYLSFGSFNKHFKPNRTKYDWLSRDPEQVDRYILDPLCGFRCTNQLWLDLLFGLGQIFDSAQQLKIPKNLPVLIAGGSEDPVSQSQGLQKLEKSFKKAGLTNVRCEIFKDCRHEILNETNKKEVMELMGHWIHEQIRSILLH